MACFYCYECDRLLDGDWIVPMEWGSDLICEDCHCELTPENWEEYILDYDPIAPKGLRWQLTHEDYDPTPFEWDGPPGDDRYFMGPSIEDVWGQAKEYEEEKCQRLKN